MLSSDRRGLPAERSRESETLTLSATPLFKIRASQVQVGSRETTDRKLLLQADAFPVAFAEPSREYGMGRISGGRQRLLPNDPRSVHRLS
jgi:hypothetical protein